MEGRIGYASGFSLAPPWAWPHRGPGPTVGGGNRLEREGTELTDESFRQATG